MAVNDLGGNLIGRWLFHQLYLYWLGLHLFEDFKSESNQCANYNTQRLSQHF